MPPSELHRGRLLLIYQLKNRRLENVSGRERPKFFRVLPICFRRCFLEFMRSSQTVGSIGAPEKIRTPNLLIRSQVLYPVELRALNSRQ